MQTLLYTVVVLLCLCTSEVNMSFNQLWLAAVEFQAQSTAGL